MLWGATEDYGHRLTADESRWKTELLYLILRTMTASTTTRYRFPFGQPVRTLVQEDRSPKKAFILGVYSSAVHATWKDERGKPLVKALAVASEPCIFWTGKDADTVIAQIEIPSKLGTLVPALPSLNGPSGVALDDHFLAPLHLDTERRADVWLCDVVPHSCRNPSQAKAIEREYVPRMAEYGLPEVSLPPVPDPLCDDQRRQEILDELQESQAKTLVLLGDEPIRWFLKHYAPRWTGLGDFGRTAETYGREHPVVIAGREYRVIPVVHPRQAGKLGAHSKDWSALHAGWVESRQNG